MSPADSLYHPPRPRGRPPLGDRQRNRLTIKLSTGSTSTARNPTGGSSHPAATTEARAELGDENETQLEEQFVLRVLPSMAAQFNKLVQERTIQDHVEIKFLDERNARVRFMGKSYVARLVDLPTITESYRTVDRKQMLKTADICQMLQVEREVTEVELELELEPVLARGMDLICADGLAPSLANVRKERFRRRIPDGRIDAIEREVLRLLEDDAQAVAVKFDVLDEQHDDARGATPSVDIMSPVTLDDLSTPLVVDEDAASSVANEDMDFDEHLAAELEQGLEELEDEPEADDDDDEEESEEEDDDDEPNNERSMQMKLLGEEIAELERTIRKKGADLDSAPNPIIRRRFEDILQRLQQELDAKRQQLDHYHRELATEGGADAAADTASNTAQL